MKIFHRAKKEHVLDAETMKTKAIKTGENSWQIVYVDAETQVPKETQKTVSMGAFKIHYNK